jgi:DUF971 family protein
VVAGVSPAFESDDVQPWTAGLHRRPGFENFSQGSRRGKFESPMRLEPTNIQQIGNELAIQWNDGTESYLDLQFLRRACPCAACGGEPDVLGNIMRPNVSYSDNSFELAGFQIVGGYAIQPSWADGHGTGIYSFQYLRRLSQPVTSK